MTFPVTVSLRSEQDTPLTQEQADDNFSGLAAAANALYGAVINDATTARTLSLTDAWKYIRMTGSPSMVTVPANATVAFDLGTEITVMRIGGAVTFAAAGGVTINASGLTIGTQYQGATLKKVGTNEWDLIGNLS